MILIVDGGATKSEWRAISYKGDVRYFTGIGINFSTMPRESLKTVIDNALEEINPSSEQITDVHFYAAGLIEDDGFLQQCFPGAEVECASDLLAAARAVCGHKAGIAAILGTGSNSCFFDGEKIVNNVSSGGFILGDEGSGAALGKMFLADLIKGLVPEKVAEEFARGRDVSYASIVQNVYRSDSPSAYLGSLAPWILSHSTDCKYLANLVENNIRDFFERALRQYEIDKYPVGMIGGFATAASQIVRKVPAEYGARISFILPSPIEGLVRYHTR